MDVEWIENPRNLPWIVTDSDMFPIAWGEGRFPLGAFVLVARPGRAFKPDCLAPIVHDGDGWVVSVILRRESGEVRDTISLHQCDILTGSEPCPPA